MHLIFATVAALVLFASGCKTANQSSKVLDDQSAGSTQTPPPAPGPQTITQLSPQMMANILTIMRLNRAAFQEQKVLDRYGEKRPPINLQGSLQQADGSVARVPVFAACMIPRKPTRTDPTLGEPLPKYQWIMDQGPDFRNAEIRPYKETEVVDCLRTKSGLAGDRPEPLAQHYYCGLTGFSPDIRSCFTFQIRVSASTRSATDDNAFLSTGQKIKLQKEWTFIGTPQEMSDASTSRKIPAHLAEKAFKYCATDGRPTKIQDKTNNAALPVDTVYPSANKPMCYVALTQQNLFQGIMGGVIDIPVADQVKLLSEYYDCPRLQTMIGTGRKKISKKTYDEYCNIDQSQWN